MGASVNLYMFFGGTNFGFSSGADYSKDNGYRPYLTSYNYDAPMGMFYLPTNKTTNILNSMCIKTPILHNIL